MPGIGTMLEAQRPDDWDITRRNQEITEKHLRPPVPNARVTNGSALTLTSGVLTTLTFNTDTWDVTNMHSTSSNTDRLVVPITGLYHVGAVIQWAVNATGQRQLRLIHMPSGNVIDITNRMTNTDGNQPIQSLHGFYRFAKNDYLLVQAYQNSGGNLNIESAGGYSPMAWIARHSGYTNEGVA